jgi:hypothetical protein
MKSRISLISTLLAIIVLNACGAKPVSTPASNGAVPNSLVAIEAAAEDIIDFAPSGGWDKINKDVTDIADAWKSYQTQASQAGASQELQDAMTSAIEKLQTASTAKDPDTTMQASNDVSAAVVEMFALYNPKVPADIGRLDVLERQVILDVAAKDYSAATKSLAKTMSVWKEVKPLVLEHNGKDVAEEFDASLAIQESALNDKVDSVLTSEARNALEIVDEMERLY